MREKKGKLSPLWMNCETEERCMVDLGDVAVDVAGMRARHGDGRQPERGNVYLFALELVHDASKRLRIVRRQHRPLLSGLSLSLQ